MSEHIPGCWNSYKIHAGAALPVYTATCTGAVYIDPQSTSLPRPMYFSKPPAEYTQSSNFYWDWFPYLFATLVGTGLFEIFHFCGWIR